MKSIKIVFLVFFSLIILPSAIIASENKKNAKKRIFGGGMLIQSVVVNLPDIADELNGFMIGIGGRLHFYITPWFRLGTIGGAFDFSYRNDSYFKFGYGGVTFEANIQVGRFDIAPGILIGGGSYTVIDKIQKNSDGSTLIRESKGSTFHWAPMLSVEFAITHSLSLTLVFDFPYAAIETAKVSGGSTATHFGGPMIAFGVIFNK